MISAKKLFLALCIMSISAAWAQQDKATWDLVCSNKISEAQAALDAKVKNNTATIDDYVMYMFVKAFLGKDEEQTEFLKYARKSENAAAYTYALWFNNPVAGQYGFKDPHQMELLNYLINEKPGNGTLRAASHYVMSHHYYKINQVQKGIRENTFIGAIEDWQFVGPFNNISGSGFNKAYEPIKDPSSASTFTSKDRAPIKWFVPKERSTDGWIFPKYYISTSGSSIIYAQSFVNSATAQDALLCVGFSGNIKVWVNDQLMLKQQEETVTELDTYKCKVHLNAGYNRVLVQIGSSEKQPNFIVRLTDNNCDPLKGLTWTSSTQAYQKSAETALPAEIPQFAESYFRERIQKDPKDILNYILLDQTLLRNDKIFEARKTIEEALKLAPKCDVLLFELLQCYLKEKNRTGISETVEYFRETESLIGMILKAQKTKDEGLYRESMSILEDRIKTYGVSEDTYDEKIQLYSKLDEVPALITTVKEAYAKYPFQPTFANYVFNVEKSVNKDPKKAIKVLEDFLKKRYDYELTNLLVKEYFAQNETKKALQLMQAQVKNFPYDPAMNESLLKEYATEQNYQEAYKISEVILQQKPFSGFYYQYKASIEAALGKNDLAVESFLKALTFQPTLYDARERLRGLQNKKPVLDAAPTSRIEDLIARTGKNINASSQDYYFLTNEEVNVLYPEGGREKRVTAAIKVLNQRGIDRFKETSLPYNENVETLIIEEAQLIKANGKKSKPDINSNQIVWEGLQENDIIYVKYKKRNYQYGKKAQEFVDNFCFHAFTAIECSRYSLIVPGKMKFNYQVINGDFAPSVSDFEDYKIYTWEKKDVEAIKDEPYMPELCDIAPTLYISTMNDWNEIAQWYRDVAYSKILSADYTLSEVYDKLFAGKTGLSADDKARIIYNYIAENINYSSVSFRQSDVIPQKASKTINTRLGDCKDISTLFISLANLCGLKANLVLIDTRDNGSKDLVLPSFNFNHCIVKYFNEKGEEIFLELTDRDLPFRSLPTTLHEALSLTIPSKDDTLAKNTLLPLTMKNKTTDKIRTAVEITVNGNDFLLTSKSTKFGSLGSGLKGQYKELDQEKADKKMRESLAKFFTNPITVSKVTFGGLDQMLDSVNVSYTLQVSNQVKKIGSVQAFKVPFMDVVFNSEPLNPETRTYDFEYWNYENSDAYETSVEVNLAGGKSFMDIPKDLALSFKNINYSITYTKVSPTKLKITRKASMQKKNISPEDYAAFKDFALKIIGQEDSYIAIQ